ncbi:threonine dehydratase biosynthetic [Sulfuriferula multivorans]|uniref:L-threonine dehydratase n=1 Tax=Sulfuriferula multivorans TaxID=1559896 RepID=A0A401JH17_9PROT|nr:threonine ammonia-lyase, biosynthetic [Sulfuriferula multivorans]GBL47287.1 threonine dehydratase biosynthetic [Sulfuriferula multivorans]
MSTAHVFNDYLVRILTSRVYDVAIESPLERAPNLSARMGNQVWLKREDLQSVFSFKLRGAYNKISGLSEQALAAGVITASAGNHAQGVALAAQKLGCHATIVMPLPTPQIKVNAVKARGAEVVLCGDSYDEAYAHAQVLAQASGATYVHAYDDPDVIAGQGTVAMEILRQHGGHIDAVFVPVGGGGLIAGMAVYIKSLKPEIKVIGVEPEDADAMARSLEQHERVLLSQVGLFADGVAVKQVGEETFRLASQYVDEIIRVDNDAICAAIKDVFEDTRSILEPSGALSIAGAKQWCAREAVTGKTVVAVASGANMNFERLRYISERAELGEQREAVLAVTIPETPGSFKAFCTLLGPRNITEFNYRYSDLSAAHVFAGVQVTSREEATQLVAMLKENGLTAVDLTDNEMAKLHVRHLVGGHAPQVEHERVYRFEFPERPGALMRFLNSIGQQWNISLFHYRNHGADYGRVLVGIQVPPDEQASFRASLDQLGYRYWDESQNPAYTLFLS